MCGGLAAHHLPVLVKRARCPISGHYPSCRQSRLAALQVTFPMVDKIIECEQDDPGLVKFSKKVE